MTPLLIFVGVLVAIWTLSGIASAVARQKDLERRRQLQVQLQGAASQQRPSAARVPAPAPRRISQGIAARFPDVLLAPQRTPARPMPMPAMPMRRPVPPAPKRLAPPIPKQQRRAVRQARRGGS